MRNTRLVRRAVIGGLGALVAAEVVAGAALAGAQAPGGGKIGPNQLFGALVNGRNGLTSPVEIQMGCVGPLRPHQTGHPLAGQTVSVFQPEDIVGPWGNTGAYGDEIGAFFGAPPPGAGHASAGAVIFRHYVVRNIPTAEVLPCSGSGRVIFVPLPMSPGTEKDVVVPVRFVGQP